MFGFSKSHCNDASNNSMLFCWPPKSTPSAFSHDLKISWYLLFYYFFRCTESRVYNLGTKCQCCPCANATSLPLYIGRHQYKSLNNIQVNVGPTIYHLNSALLSCYVCTLFAVLTLKSYNLLTGGLEVTLLFCSVSTKLGT